MLEYREALKKEIEMLVELEELKKEIKKKLEENVPIISIYRFINKKTGVSLKSALDFVNEIKEKN